MTGRDELLPRVLIVDDLPDNLFALERVLRPLPVELVRANGGNEALTASLNHDFALAILDVHMPEMDGYELAEYLRGDPRTSSLPIIFLTAERGNESHVFRGYESGAVDYIIKPYPPAVLRSKVSVFLELHRKRQALERSNVLLREEVERRRDAETALSRLNETLEDQVHTRTSELEAVNRELESFADSVSHDLRAPLRAIEAYREALEEDFAGVLPEEGRLLLQRLGRSATHMSELVAALLRLARVHQRDLVREAFDGGILVDEALGKVRGLRPERNPEVICSEPLPLFGDRLLVGQIFQNLLDNAFKATSERSPGRIVVSPLRRTDMTGFVVEDDGRGFPVDEARHLFAPFHRIDSGGDPSGLGIGLATVRRIVHRHGGRIEAEGRPGEGARFTVLLPARRTGEDPPSSADASSSTGEASSSTGDASRSTGEASRSTGEASRSTGEASRWTADEGGGR